MFDSYSLLSMCVGSKRESCTQGRGRTVSVEQGVCIGRVGRKQRSCIEFGKTGFRVWPTEKTKS